MGAFEEALKKKFDAGHKEHQQKWDKDTIQSKEEIQDELLDIFNYASLRKDEEIYRELMGIARFYWKRLNHPLDK